MGRKEPTLMNISVDGSIEPSPKMTRFTPVQLTGNGWMTTPFATSGSLHDLAGTDGFIEIPAGELQPDSFNYYPWTSR